MANNFMESLIKYNNQTAGRDRAFRLLQYGSRILWWLAEKCKYDKASINKLKNLEYALSGGRKLLRLGKCLDILYGALKTIHLKDLTLRLTLTMGKINQSLYLLTDHVTWFGRTGLVDIDKEKWAKRANKFWLCSILFLLLRDIYELWYLISLEMRLQSQCGVLSGSDFPGLNFRNLQCPRNPSHYDYPFHEQLFTIFGPISRWAVVHKDVVLDTVKNGCDLVIPLTGLGYANISPGVVGLCGVISSIIGMMTIMNPLVRLQPS